MSTPFSLLCIALSGLQLSLSKQTWENYFVDKMQSYYHLPFDCCDVTATNGSCLKPSQSH